MNFVEKKSPLEIFFDYVKLLMDTELGRLFLSKITCTSSPGKFPFKVYRRQFPVKLCYAMTINKSQGQTIDFVGLDLEEPVFAHGMTYVGFSRVSAWNCLRVAVNK